MRPVDYSLRQQYLAAAKSLREEGLPVTAKNLALEMGLKKDAVRTFLHRNRDFALSLEMTKRPTNTATDYSAIIHRHKARGRPLLHREIAELLGIERCSVSRFLSKHPELLNTASKVGGLTFTVRYQRVRSGEWIEQEMSLREYAQLLDEGCLGLKIL